MQHKIQAEIYGKILHSPRIYHTEGGLIYSVIVVNAIRNSENYWNTDKVFPIFLWGKDVVRSSLRFCEKGKKVWLVGLVEPINEAFKGSIPKKWIDNKNEYIVSIVDKTRIVSINLDFIHTSINVLNSKDDGFVWFNYVEKEKEMLNLAN